MALTNSQITLIQGSFRRLSPKTEAASEIFYDRLFGLSPDLRDLFRGDMAGQGMRFMTTMGILVQHLDDPEALRPYLQRLAEGHAAYGVKAEHFKPMGQALIQTMRETLGDDFHEDAARAWEVAYDHLAHEMIRLA